MASREGAKRNHELHFRVTEEEGRAFASLCERLDSDRSSVAREALLVFIAAAPLPKPLFVGLSAGHAATRKMGVEEAIERLKAVGVAAFTDPVELVKAAARAVK